MMRVEELPDDPDAPVPGYRTFLIFTDESGMHGTRYFGFGSLWMPNERRGTFSGLIKDLRERHKYLDEIKWKKINKYSRQFYLDLVAEFFQARWLMFHCYIVREAYVDLSLHEGSLDLARRKHFDTFIGQKIGYFSAGAKDKAYLLRMDTFPTKYKKFSEAAEKIINRTVAQRIGHGSLKSVVERDSKSTPGIQVADVLLGAVMADWDGDATAEPKLAVKASVAEHLGWTDLRADTRPSEWKFNIWTFYAPTWPGPREAQTRNVRLKIPMPPLNRGPAQQA